MIEKKNKQVAKITILITSIFVIFISFSYAFLNQILSGTKRQVITSGNLELKLEESEAITLANALPMYDEVGLIQKPYLFTLVNNSDSTVPYQLKLIDATSSDNKLDPALVKYGLTKNDKTTSKYLSNLIDGVIDTGKIQGKETIEYALRLWIDSSVEDETLISGKTLSYKVEVEANQVVAKPNMPMMRKRDTSNSTEMFYGYEEQITSIIFEDKIDIPQTISNDKKWDISAEEGTGQVMAYIEETEESTQSTPLYKLHIQGKNGVKANEKSNNSFALFTKLTAIENMEYFDTANATTMYGMFDGCSSLINLDVSHFDTSNVVDMGIMFRNCNSLTSLDLSNFDTSNVTSMITMFGFCSSLTNLDLSSFDTSNVTAMSGMFRGCSNLISLDVSNFNTSNVQEMSSMFGDCSSLTSLDLSSFYTPKLKAMFQMFNNCKSLINLDVSHFDTSNITDMRFLFQNCSCLKNLDLSSFDTTNVTFMGSMFENCANLVSLNIKNFNNSNVISMNAMFKNCRALINLDLSNFAVPKVQDMAVMFYNCSSLTELDLSNFDTSNVTAMSGMFYGCSNLTTLNLSSFNTSNVTNMSTMFQNCSSLKNLDLTNFDTSNVTNTRSMFQDCSGLANLMFGEKTIFSKAINHAAMFQGTNPTVHVKTQDQADSLKKGFPTLNVEVG